MTIVHIPELGGDRRSGRTTRMILAAIQAMRQGRRVLILGTDDRNAVRYLKQLFEDSWVVDSVRIVENGRHTVRLGNGGFSRFSSLARDFRGERYDDVFIDHNALESRPAEVDRVVEFFEVRTHVKKSDGPTMWEILMSEDS